MAAGKIVYMTHGTYIHVSTARSPSLSNRAPRLPVPLLRQFTLALDSQALCCSTAVTSILDDLRREAYDIAFAVQVWSVLQCCWVLQISRHRRARSMSPVVMLQRCGVYHGHLEAIRRASLRHSCAASS